ncbi:thiamine pyrophosphate enzyme-like TPP binding region [Rubrobacter xylanophilus DSM 9941]|uniref:Thiamine pyrophosphate enzyme-like TPP binding region n=1 Tax=Rubrobacter xylanophilus (strain DSM 9941 / JCM 11954 / NBRC 16129 / PRD-1) TaxID=266117 RepID=Q1ATS7_RUBXD|nr:thiamine pyrophosphate-binding protein [Rubrobacter xylanophilus]ABG05201.1 thiamine pyrophosphate enzyme-like TPP binding region [Rubrobacter xylanophilus DSM 9941]
MRVCQAIGQVLADRGVEVFFGLVGSGNFTVVDALQKAGAKFYSARHECGAVMMADGYARASGKVGVCSTHQGPGFTNALTGLTEAAKNRTPLLLLAADTPPETLWSNFKIDQGAIAERAGAVAERVRSPETAAEDTARALRRTQVERRPVVLNIPINLAEMPCPDEPQMPDVPELEPPRPGERSVARAADLLETSERPVILAGRGAVLSGARKELEALAERVGALLATTAMGHGLFAGNPYCVGIAGGFSSPLAVELLSRVDLVLAFGASLNRWTVRHGRLFPPEARVVQVDLDEEAIGALHRVDAGVVGDAAASARDMVRELERRGVRKSGLRGEEMEREISARRWRDEPYEDEGTPESIDPRTLSIALDDLLPEERTVATDSGHFLGYPAMYLSVPDERGFVFPNAFQSVGLGLGSGIGAAIARPDRISVAAIGDGGALMALGELETAARYRLPMVVLIYNDAAYGAEVHHFGPMGHPVDSVRFPDTDFAALAGAAGATGITVRSPDDLAPLKEWLGRRDGPLVIDAKVNPDVRAEWLEEAFRAH